MTNRELRRLSRRELLTILIEQLEENEKLRSSLEKAEMELQNRQIILEQAGTMAEAALKLNGVFDAVDKAVRQYLENVQRQARESRGSQ